MIGIIAGHRGPGTGAVGHIDEGAETIVMKKLIIEELKKAKVDFIEDDGTESLKEVINKLKITLNKKDICVDLHFNSFVSENAQGSEVLIPLNNTPDEKLLAEKLLETTCKVLKTRNRGIRTEKQSAHGRLGMLSGFDCCNILIEICFVSNKTDAEKYFKNKEKLAKEYAKILIDFSKSNK